MHYSQLNCGYYLAHKDNSIKIIEVKKAKAIEGTKFLIVMGRIGGQVDVEGYDFKRVELEQIWELL